MSATSVARPSVLRAGLGFVASTVLLIAALLLLSGIGSAEIETSPRVTKPVLRGSVGPN